MKKIIIITMMVLLLTALCACTKAPVPADGPETAAASAAPETAEDEAADSADECIELTAVLAAVRDSYFPRTAGCTLTAAGYAGELMDIFTEYEPSQEALKRAARLTAEGYDGGEAKFSDKLADIYAAAKLLMTEDTAADLLECAGYSPKHFPWEESSVEEMFLALFAGLGETVPNQSADDK